MQTLLDVKNLNIYFGNKQIIHNVNFSLKKNEVLGIVGESGSGKSVLSLAILKLLSPKANIIGNINYYTESGQTDLLKLSEKNIRAYCTKDISMIFQEPMSSLNPSLKCGFQVMEALLYHTKISKNSAKKKVLELFEKVKLPRVNDIYDAYPHQLSGGQLQRIMIAMAISCNPKILIADEPTTALDITIQKDILILLKEIQRKTQMSVIFITHDLDVVSYISDNILVINKGRIVEQDKTSQILNQPKEDYTKGLIGCRIPLDKRYKILPVVNDFSNGNTPNLSVESNRKQRHCSLYKNAPIFEVKELCIEYIKRKLFGKNITTRAVNRVNFEVYKGEIFGLVGESGCGKSSLSKAIMQLQKPNKGSIFYKGEDITILKGKRLFQARKKIQLVFQDPYSSLSPKYKIGNAIMDIMTIHNILEGKLERKKYILELLEKVGLDSNAYFRYPHEFSGGQRQRISIAKALCLQPEFIIFDEAVAALDVSVQAQILNLLKSLKYELNLTYIFISHNLAVIKYLSDRIMVMNEGKIEEIQEADKLYQQPKKEYTRKLINAISLPYC